MSHHASYTLGGALSVGGIIAYAKKKSAHSLVAGMGLGTLFLFSGFLIQRHQNHFLAHSLGTIASVALIGAGASRYPKTAKKQVPVLLLSLGGLMLPYQAYKLWQWKDDAPWSR